MSQRRRRRPFRQTYIKGERGVPATNSQSMECELPALLRLPQELRDEIYKYVLVEEDEIRLAHQPNAPHIITSCWLKAPRYQARLLQQTGPQDGLNARMSAAAPLCQLNKQIRLETSDFLECSKLPIVARVVNFDFGHVMQYLREPAPRPRLQRHAAREDGASPGRLMIELSGPYGGDWEKNLMAWIESIDRLLPEQSEELAALHKTVQFAGRWTVYTPANIVRTVGELWQRRPVGAGRRELEKVFLALFCRHEVEVELNWHWATDPVTGEMAGRYAMHFCDLPNSSRAGGLAIVRAIKNGW